MSNGLIWERGGGGGGGAGREDGGVITCIYNLNSYLN